MRAIVLEKFGGLDSLVYKEIPDLILTSAKAENVPQTRTCVFPIVIYNGWCNRNVRAISSRSADLDVVGSAQEVFKIVPPAATT